MSFTATYTFTAYEILTAAELNAIQDNINYLHNAIASLFLLSGAGAWPSTTSGATAASRTEMATNKQNLNNPTFASGVQSFLEVSHPLPDDYNGGTVTAQFYWETNSTSTNSVVWGLQGRAYADNDVIDQAWGTAGEVTDANGSTANTQRISAASSAITLAGSPAAGQMARWRIYRKGSGSDNLAVSVLLDSVKITYTRA